VETLVRFRLMAVRLSLGLTAAGGLVGMWLDKAAGWGVLVGGVTGVLVFWIIARQAERLAIIGSDKVKGIVYRWTVLRMGLYGLALWKGYDLDTVSYHGVMGAVAGLLIIHFILLFLGLTGLDLKAGGDKTGAKAPEAHMPGREE